MSTLMLCGVYMIRCRPTGEFYVGGTKTSFIERFASHARDLRGGRHQSRALQALFDEHGSEAIEFLPLKAFPADQVHDREREAIRRLQPALNPRPIKAVDLTQLAKDTGLSQQMLRARVARGLTGEDLIAPPHRTRRKQYTRQK